MKFCQDHWDKLRAAIADRGLDRLKAADGAEAARHMVGGEFEPLMGAHNAILGNALDAGGMAIMMPNDDGSDRCPLCYLLASCRCGKGDGCPFNTWITRAADDALARARELGLVATG